MKKLFVSFMLLFAIIHFLQAQPVPQTVPDTLWTKITGPQSVNSVRFSPDGNYVAAGTDQGHIYIYNSLTGELLKQFYHPKGVEELAFSIDGKYLASCGDDGLARIWDIQHDSLFKTLLSQTLYPNFDGLALSLNFSIDRKYLAVNQTVSDKIFIFNTNDFTLIDSIQRPFARLTVRFSPDNHYLAVSTYQDKSGNSYVELVNTTNWQIETDLYPEVNNIIKDIEYSPDGTMLATACWDGHIRIWDMNTKKMIRDINEGNGIQIRSISFRHDNQSIFFSEGNYESEKLKEIRIQNDSLENEWDWAIFRGASIQAISVHPNDSIIAIGDELGLVLIKVNNITSVKEISNTNEEQIKPNPTNGLVIISYLLLKPDNIKIELYSSLGSFLKQLQNIFTDLGYHEFSFDASFLASGQYFIKVSSDSFTKTYKLVKE